MKTALITGITGQDGSYLAELLLKRGWRVFGVVRQVSARNYWRIRHLEDLVLVQGDITDIPSLIRILNDLKPTHIFHLASQSFVPTSWEQPILTSETTGIGALNIFEATFLQILGRYSFLLSIFLQLESPKHL